jgi:hypothetical protein
MVRIFFNSLTTSRPTFSIHDLVPITSFTSCRVEGGEIERSSTKDEVGENIFKLIFFRNNPSRRPS